MKYRKFFSKAFLFSLKAKHLPFLPLSRFLFSRDLTAAV